MSTQKNPLTLSFKKTIQKNIKKYENGAQGFNEFIGEFLGNFLSSQTKRAYINDLDSFFSFLSIAEITINHPNEIRSQYFMAYRDFLIEQNYSSSTINRKLVCIRSFMKWALSKKLIDHNPLDALKLPKVQTQSPTQAFTDQEVTQILALPNRKNKDEYMHYMALKMLFYLGLRRSELAHIKLKDFIKDRGGEILSIKGKGGKVRYLPISKELLEDIENYKHHVSNIYNFQWEPNSFLLVSKKTYQYNKNINDATLYKILNKYVKLAGIDKRVSPHSCRATAISHLLDTQHASIRDVAQFAGHSNITTTERYDKKRKGIEDNPAKLINFKKSS